MSDRMFEIDYEELQHIVVSVLGIAVAFTIATTVRNFKFTFDPLVFVIYLVTVGSGFVLHELAHKFLAQTYGALATYRSWTTGLALMLITSFFGIVFAAPGAVYIFSPNLTREQNGKISLVGPLTNIVLAFIFFFVGIGALSFLLTGVSSEAIKVILRAGLLGAQVNMWLAFFNMIPIFPLDGSKVFEWNSVVWGVVFFFALIMSFGPLFIF
ncbi:site-2 protease family protein [Candidatus Micrarchaeota archaeon]|nr:site-2 protease family protein [Candidatus Micrarchaeota archaeon]